MTDLDIPWLVACICGIALGLYANVLFERYSGRRSEALGKIAIELTELAQTLKAITSCFEPRSQTDLPSYEAQLSTVAETEAFRPVLAKYGIRFPRIEFEADPVGYFFRMLQYLETMTPILLKGDIARARKHAELVAVDLERSAPQLPS